jgi:hypothetical protein
MNATKSQKLKIIGQHLVLIATTPVGRCAGEGSHGSWDEPTYSLRSSSGTSGPAQHDCVWPGCDTHHSATGYPVAAEVYKSADQLARRLGISIDALCERVRCMLDREFTPSPYRIACSLDQAQPVSA